MAERELIVAGGRLIERPEGWRRIEVQPFYDYARRAAAFLVAVGAADEVYPSFTVPDLAVWSLNGEPQLPAARIGGGQSDG